MHLPNLSEYDPDTKGEGSIDPLGLYGIADSLGVRLVPAVRERQTTVRFLTAMAVSLWISENFDPDQLSEDGTSEPWQVFEWYTVEGLVRSFADQPQEFRGTPGSSKAQTAISDRQPLCAERYLKTPTVFGFHGVYRILARDLDIDTGGRLGDFGYQLLETWASEQGIPGFVHDGQRPGAELRRALRDAVTDGLRSNCVARKHGWDGWKFFGDYLPPHRAGQREAEKIRDGLLNASSGFRREVLDFLASSTGRKAWIADSS